MNHGAVMLFWAGFGVGVTLLACYLVGWFIVDEIQTRRKKRLEEEMRAQAIRYRARARVLSVGKISYQGEMLVLEDGWLFDLLGFIPVTGRCHVTGDHLFCGYTKEELIDIHRRPDEFVHRP